MAAFMCSKVVSGDWSGPMRKRRGPRFGRRSSLFNAASGFVTNSSVRCFSACAQRMRFIFRSRRTARRWSVFLQLRYCIELVRREFQSDLVCITGGSRVTASCHSCELVSNLYLRTSLVKTKACLYAFFSVCAFSIEMGLARCFLLLSFALRTPTVVVHALTKARVMCRKQSVTCCLGILLLRSSHSSGPPFPSAFLSAKFCTSCS